MIMEHVIGWSYNLTHSIANTNCELNTYCDGSGTFQCSPFWKKDPNSN